MTPTEFYTSDGKIAYVRQVANTILFTFYARPAGRTNHYGRRIKTRQPMYFRSRDEALVALAAYAKKRGWKR